MFQISVCSWIFHNIDYCLCAGHSISSRSLITAGIERRFVNRQLCWLSNTTYKATGRAFSLVFNCHKFVPRSRIVKSKTGKLVIRVTDNFVITYDCTSKRQKRNQQKNACSKYDTALVLLNTLNNRFRHSTNVAKSVVSTGVQSAKN